MLAEILIDTNPEYFKWAVGSIFHWKQTEKIPAYRIHGSSDRILPISKNCKPNLVINNGGHFFTVTHADEISRYLKQILIHTK